jgi:hypothetical protein
MSATTIIYIIIQIAAGAIGGNIFAKITQFTLGPLSLIIRLSAPWAEPLAA